MALLPGHRYLEPGETVLEGTLADFGGSGLRQATSIGATVVTPNFYMVPIAKPRRVRSYMPPETSLEAHRSQKDKAPADGTRILETIAKAHVIGCTCDEVETMLQFSHQTASARIRDLAKAHLIRDSGLRRKTRTGRTATVWRAVAP